MDDIWWYMYGPVLVIALLASDFMEEEFLEDIDERFVQWNSCIDI